MKKTISLALCVVMVIMAFATTAFARYERCPQCNSRFKFVSESSPRNYSHKQVPCKKGSAEPDVQTTYYTTELWECSNSNCSEYDEIVVKHVEVDCDH